MQLNRVEGWIERSMLYACRGFDSLSHGDDYIEAGMSAQISFLNFMLSTLREGQCRKALQGLVDAEEE